MNRAIASTNPDASRRAAAGLSPAMRRLLADFWRGAAEPKSLVAWATDRLVEGQDSLNLRILAGLTGEDGREVEEYFAKVMAEFGLPIPDQRECLIYYCGDVARDVLGGA